MKPLGGEPLRVAQRVSVLRGARTSLRQRVGDGRAGAASEVGHPHALGFRADGVGHHLEHPVADCSQRVTDGEQLVGGSRRAGNVAVPRAVQHGARRAEAGGAGPHRPLDHDGHLRDLVVCGVVVGALAHHVSAYCAMRNLRGDVHDRALRVQRVEVLLEGLPAPVDALVQRSARDVLDALHQLDQEVLLARAHRREADSAVAHDDRGDAVPARGRELGIPAHLAVVVRVDVDPAGGEHQPVPVELSATTAVDGPDLGDVAAVHGHVAHERGTTGAVRDRGSSNHEVVHPSPLSLAGTTKTQVCALGRQNSSGRADGPLGGAGMSTAILHRLAAWTPRPLSSVGRAQPW